MWIVKIRLTFVIEKISCVILSYGICNGLTWKSTGNVVYHAIMAIYYNKSINQYHYSLHGPHKCYLWHCMCNPAVVASHNIMISLIVKKKSQFLIFCYYINTFKFTNFSAQSCLFLLLTICTLSTVGYTVGLES
jgi:hypothetical protein